MLENLDSYNYGARAWATRVFAGIGDPAALDLLLKATVSDFSQSVRRAAAKGLGSIIWSKLPVDEVVSAQQKVLKTLLLATEDGEWVVRYAAIVGLEALGNTLATSQPKSVSEIINKFQYLINSEPETAIRARIEYAMNNHQTK